MCPRNRNRHRQATKEFYQKVLAVNRNKTKAPQHDSSTPKSKTDNLGVTKAPGRWWHSKWRRRSGRFLKVFFLPFKKKYLVTTIALMVCITSLLTVFYLAKSKPIEIRAELTGLGDIDFAYSGKQNLAISPLCGCYDEQPREQWRGITFPARYLQLNREGSKPLTGYMMTVAEPGNMTWWSSMFRLRGSIYTFAVPENENFDSRVLLNEKFPETYRVLNRRRYTRAHHFLLISSKGLNISLLGDMPLGSWVPADESQVSVKYQREGMHLNARNVAVIEEHYKNTEANIETLEVPNVPLGDFLGPNVIFWSEDESAIIIAGDDVLQLEQSLPEGQKVIHAIVTEPPFSVRVAVDPLDKGLADHYIKSMKDYGALPAEERKKYESYGGSRVIGQLDDGKITVSIIDPEKQSEEFDAVYQRMKENEVVDRRVDINAMSETKPFEQSWIMNFRYPPIPPNKGFNIFGPISSMKFSRAIGDLALGSRNINIKVPSSLDFREIQSLDIEKGVFAVPVQLNTAAEKARIQIKATSETFLNDTPLNRRADEYKLNDLHLPIFGITIGVLSLLIAVWSRTRK